MTAALRTAHATARSLGRQLRMRGSGPGGRAKRKIWHGLDQTSLLLLGSTSNLACHREELCFILSGTSLSVFLQAASRKHCCIHICQSCGRYIGHCGLNHRRRCHASVLPAKRWGSISPRRFNCFHTRRNLGPFSLAQVPPASAARLD